MINKRTIRITEKLPLEYLSMDEEYYVDLPSHNSPYIQPQVYFTRVNGSSGTFTSYERFKQYLREGKIVFTN